jgi:hypothetical protein
MTTDVFYKIEWKKPVLFNLSVTNTSNDCNKPFSGQDGALENCGS